MEYPVECTDVPPMLMFFNTRPLTAGSVALFCRSLCRPFCRFEKTPADTAPEVLARAAIVRVDH